MRAALALLVLTACAGQPDPASPPEDSLLLRDVTLIDGTGAPPREHVSVLVRSGVIQEIGEALEARAAVTRLRELGVDLIKIHNAVPRDAFFALAAEAQKQGIPFAGHVPMTVDPAEAAEAGQHSVEHIVTLVEGTYMARFPNETAAIEAMTQWSQDELPVLAETFAQHGTWFVPTIIAYDLRTRRGELADRPDPRLRYAPPILRKAWDRDSPVTERDRDPEVIARRRRFVELGREMTRRMHEAGVGIAVGSDLAGRDVLPGFSVHDEIGHLVASGLTPMEALRAGTSEAARLLNASDTLGTIAPGKAADLVLLDADPLADVKNVGRISAVVLRGKLLERGDLDRLLEAATRQPAGGARPPGSAPRRRGV